MNTASPFTLRRLALGIGAATFCMAAVGCSGAVRGSTSTSDETADLVAAGAPDGGCLLEYNAALVSGSADTCCATVDGENTCNVAIQCNGSSGADCCLIYATDASAGGEGCCLYAGGSPPSTAAGSDRTSQCNALLNYRR